jgi:hypothetical protein
MDMPVSHSRIQFGFYWHLPCFVDVKHPGATAAAFGTTTFGWGSGVQGPRLSNDVETNLDSTVKRVIAHLPIPP